ncbi:MAG: DedA family protein [Ktedonobacteraceae bacterium]
MSHLIDSLTAVIQNLYVVTGLVGIVLAMAIESCCIPLPSEIVMPLAGVMIASHQRLLGVDPNAPVWLNLLLLALSGAIGCLLGSILAYGIGYVGGRPLLLKYGKYVLISQHDTDKADHFFQRWGSATAFFSRLLPVVRTYISLPAGMTKMSFSKFCIYTFLGSLPWCLLLIYLGYQLGNNYTTLSGPIHGLDGVIAVVFVGLVVLYVWRHIRNDRRARAEHTAIATQNTQKMQNPSWGQPTLQGQPMPPQQWGRPGQPPPTPWQTPQGHGPDRR